MAKLPLRLDELIDGEALRRDLTALTADTQGDGSSPAVRSAVLMTLGANVTQEMAQAIWQQGGAHFSGVDQVQKAQPALAVIEHPECFDVRSNYFRARGLITLDGVPFEFGSLLDGRSGPGGGIHVLQRNRGGD